GGDLIQPLPDTATPVQVAHDVAHVIFRRHHLDLHDGLEQHRIGLHEAFFEGHRGCYLERHLRGVDVMIRTVVKSDLDVDHRITGQDAVLHLLLDALVDRGNVILGHDAANDGIDKLVALTALQRLDAKPDVTVLTTPTRLPDELAFLLDQLADGLAVGNLRLADVALDLELPLHAVDNDLEMQLTHAGDDGLPRLLVGADAE